MASLSRGFLICEAESGPGCGEVELQAPLAHCPRSVDSVKSWHRPEGSGGISRVLFLSSPECLWLPAFSRAGVALLERSPSSSAFHHLNPQPLGGSGLCCPLRLFPAPWGCEAPGHRLVPPLPCFLAHSNRALVRWPAWGTLASDVQGPLPVPSNEVSAPKRPVGSPAVTSDSQPLAPRGHLTGPHGVEVAWVVTCKGRGPAVGRPSRSPTGTGRGGGAGARAHRLPPLISRCPNPEAEAEPLTWRGRPERREAWNPALAPASVAQPRGPEPPAALPGPRPGHARSRPA